MKLVHGRVTQGSHTRMNKASSEKMVRIKIGEGRGVLDFKASESFNITNAKDEIVIKECIAKNSWRIKVEEKTQEPIFEIFDAEYRQSAKIERELIIHPIDKTTTFTLFDLVIGEGFHWEYHSKKQFNGTIRFVINDKRNVDAVIILPLEEYLKGVVPAEMGYHYPVEALKAQAVVSRTWTIKHMQDQHTESYYDVCSDRHCQLFHPQSTTEKGPLQAIEQTKGEVVTCQNQLVPTYFHSICGGHTDETICEGTEKNLSNQGVYDSNQDPALKVNLKQEKDVEKWVKESPNVYCNLQKVMGHQKLDAAKRYFRWEITYTRRELEEIIENNLNKDIGVLYGILVSERGASGRIKEIELLCSNDNFKIKGELNIRQTLSEKALNSSCFIVQTEMDHDGIPVTFTLMGAGSGHGKGLCQTGAAAMAIKNIDYKHIIAHYFPKTEIEQYS